MVPEAISPDEADSVVTLVAAEQARPERLITYVGTDAAGIRAELDGLAPPWTSTARVVRGRKGSIVGVSIVEWDEELGRAWILGPWVAGDAAAWDDNAGPLLDAALVQLPARISQHELAGDAANALLGELAIERGWTPSEPNHIMVADASTVAAWPEWDAEAALRPPRPQDAPAIAALHDVEFPGTYASAEKLVEGHADGSRVVLVVDGPGGTGIAGYAAGEVHDDGEGFIDYIVVAPSARGRGLGPALVMALTRDLLARSSLGRVGLTVAAHRTPARSVYKRLGFRSEGILVAYRSWT